MSRQLALLVQNAGTAPLFARRGQRAKKDFLKQLGGLLWTWKRGTITLAIRNGQGEKGFKRVPVTGYILEGTGWGVHHPYEQKSGWSVTHLKTGYSAGYTQRTLKNAKALAQEFAAELDSKDLGLKELATQADAMRTIVMRFPGYTA